MKTLDRALITFTIVVLAVSAYGSYRQRQAMDALIKSNLILIEVLVREEGPGA